MSITHRVIHIFFVRSSKVNRKKDDGFPLYIYGFFFLVFYEKLLVLQIGS